MEKTELKTNEMVRAIRDQIHEETKHLTPEQFAEYIRREAALAAAEEVAEEAESARHAA
ncbi:MAG TPA: hypothetical protein VGB15_02560 [Longimicrobium sp.]|jgi:hypothetical protein